MKTAGQIAIERLETALATYRERNAHYKDSFSRWGPVFRALFPNGIRIETEDDWNRIVCLGHIIDKLVRYTTFFNQPHEDSIHDLGVYAFIMQGLDAEMRQRDGVRLVSGEGRALTREELAERSAAIEKKRAGGE